LETLRNLLLDCRTALRQAVAGFEQTPLGARLNAAILELRRAEQTRKADAAPDHSIAKRVAYAWQAVARDLRYSHPDLYQQLSDKVLARLDVAAVDDASGEIADLQAQLARLAASSTAGTDELAQLRATLAEAVPLVDAPGGSAAELARLRLQRLVEAASSHALHEARDLATPAPTADGAPGRDRLQAVAAGTQSLQAHEREWCIGEAMVLTGFQRTPVQLLEDGDAALARIVLDGMPPGA